MLVCSQMSLTETASIFVLKPKRLRTQTQIACANFGRATIDKLIPYC